MKRHGKAAGSILVGVCAAAVLLLPSDTAKGVSDGITLCLERIVPSVFPMMLVCVMAVECGLAAAVGKLLAPVSVRLFGLPGECAAAVLMSLLGGYPAGAKTVAELCESGAVTRQQASRMMLFCFCSGPAFLIGVAGGLAGSPAAGCLLLGVQAVVVLLMGLLVRMIYGTDDRDSCCRGTAEAYVHKPVSEVIVNSVSRSASAVLQVCLYVIIFSAVNAVADSAGINSAVRSLLTGLGLGERSADAVLPAILEVTGGCVRAAEVGLPMIAFAVGFGGLSVHMQVLALTRKLQVNLLLFFAARVLQGLLSAALTAGVLAMLPEGTAVPASAQLHDHATSGSPQGAVVLVVMCAVCVLCLPPAESEQRSIWGSAHR